MPQASATPDRARRRPDREQRGRRRSAPCGRTGWMCPAASNPRPASRSGEDAAFRRRGRRVRCQPTLEASASMDCIDDYFAYPDARGHFGDYGGSFVAETLIGAAGGTAPRPTTLRARSGVHRRARARPQALRRPPEPDLPRRAPVRRSRRRAASCSSARTSTTPARTRSTTPIGQALVAQRMGKRRIIAETGAGQHGVATRDGVPRGSGSNASSTWARPTSSGRRSTSIA